jgi:hypothetical protein
MEVNIGLMILPWQISLFELSVLNEIMNQSYDERLVRIRYTAKTQSGVPTCI